MGSEEIRDVVVASLEDGKGRDIRVMDVRGVTTITDYMILVTGSSDRHVKALADRVLDDVKGRGVRPFGVEGEREGEWILVDLSDVIVHLMLPNMREFYNLEKLWSDAHEVPADSTRQG